MDIEHISELPLEMQVSFAFGYAAYLILSSPIVMCQFLPESPARAGAYLALDADGYDCTA